MIAVSAASCLIGYPLEECQELRNLSAFKQLQQCSDWLIQKLRLLSKCTHAHILSVVSRSSYWASAWDTENHAVIILFFLLTSILQTFTCFYLPFL